MIRFEETLHKQDSDGALFVRYTPYIEGVGNMASGKVSFASWEVAVGAPKREHDAAKDEAIANVKAVLQHWLIKI